MGSAYAIFSAFQLSGFPHFRELSEAELNPVKRTPRRASFFMPFATSESLTFSLIIFVAILSIKVPLIIRTLTH